MSVLSKKEINQFTEYFENYIKKNISNWLSDVSLAKPPQVYEIELRERMIRVEEELKNQRELIKQMIEQMDKRFEQVDKRFEYMQINMDKRFEQVDKRFEQMDKRFESLTKRIDRFMIWSFGITVSMGGIVIAVLKLWK